MIIDYINKQVLDQKAHQHLPSGAIRTGVRTSMRKKKDRKKCGKRKERRKRLREGGEDEAATQESTL